MNIELQPGQKIGQYTIVKELGRGNNGIVYLAAQELMERFVACKILMPEVVEEPGYTDAFIREARTAAKLNHPNIVQAIDVGKDDDKYFFIMEYIDGDELETIRQNQPELLSPKFIISMAIQLASALDHAWRKHRIIHGDIKPENIIIRRSDNTPKIADLGLARVVGDNADGEIMATPLYAAPEVIMQSGGDPDPRSDIYSFGIMLYELCCGRPPFFGNMEEILNKHVCETPLPLLRRNPDMNVLFAAFIDKMIAKSPDHRPASWGMVMQELISIRSIMFPRNRKTPALNRIPNNPQSKNYAAPRWVKPLILTLATSAAAAAAILTVWLLTR